MSEKEEITRTRDRGFITLNVQKENCFKRWDGLKEKIRAYRNQNYQMRNEILKMIKETNDKLS